MHGVGWLLDTLTTTAVGMLERMRLGVDAEEEWGRGRVEGGEVEPHGESVDLVLFHNWT
jgi:hypothetical protein